MLKFWVMLILGLLAASLAEAQTYSYCVTRLVGNVVVTQCY